MNVGPRYEQRRAQIMRDYAAFSRKATRLCTAESLLQLVRKGVDVTDLLDAYFRDEAITSAQIAARGIVSPEGIETGTGSTATPPEPGPEGARPSKGFLKGESPQATWPFAQDDKGTE